MLYDYQSDLITGIYTTDKNNSDEKSSKEDFETEPALAQKKPKH